MYTVKQLADLAAMTGQDPASPAVIARWHQNLRYFYEPTIERLEGLSQLYVDSPDFATKFRAIHTDLPEFMGAAITHYGAVLRQEPWPSVRPGAS